MGDNTILTKRQINAMNVHVVALLLAQGACNETHQPVFCHLFEIGAFRFLPDRPQIRLLADDLIGVVFAPPIDEPGAPQNPACVYRIAVKFGER